MCGNIDLIDGMKMLLKEKYCSCFYLKFFLFIITIGISSLACKTFTTPFTEFIYPTETEGIKSRLPKKATQTVIDLNDNESNLEDENKTPRDTALRDLIKTPGSEEQLNAIIRGYFTPTGEFTSESLPLATATITPETNQPTIDQAIFTPFVTNTPVDLPAWIDSELRASDPSQVKLNSGKYQFIEFFAFWCGTCQALAPEIHNLEEKYTENIIFTYLDIDDPSNEYFMKKLRFEKEPHFILVDGEGNKQKEWIGHVTYEELFEIFKEIANSN